jgi:hypothetical protein
MSWTLVLGIPLGLASPVQAAGKPDDPETFFELKVRPVLAGVCVKCHGATKASGGLRLDSREAMVKGGDSGPALVPGNPDESLIVQAVRYDDELLQMPPKKPLDKGVRADLAAWVASGAVWPKSGGSAATIEGRGHWAFEPIKNTPTPADPSGWAEGPIDAHIAAAQRAHGVAPVGQADRRTLIRRAYLDLIGLPPEPQRVESFVADDRPDAFARLIDELLASPRYGERWGRYWLDLARYADTAGDNSDYPIPEAYLYRDYVIDAFNADIPYDRFLHEQLAGDILAKNGPREDYARRVVATGFVAQAKRFGTRKLEDIHQIIEDTLNTTGQVVLGLSLRCARCHDHKFDPLTSRDYYSLYGIFASTQYPFAGAEEVKRPSEFAPLVPPDEVKAREAAHAETLARLKREIEVLGSTGSLAARIRDLDMMIAQAEWLCTSADDSHDLAELRTERAKVQTQIEARRKELKAELARREKASALAGVPMAYAVREARPTDARIQKGGNPRALGETVKRGVPKILDPSGTLPIAEGASGRLELARWLTEGPARDLTARVMVNRIWQHHFTRPIVPTPSDFGLRGTPPSHPELLDHLAREFIASGWSIKAMHRKIMLSKTYQLASTHDQAAFEKDSGNTWYWRSDRRRLDAEALRDTLLALGGNLDPSRPGPHPFPPVERWRYTAHRQFKALYPSDHRSVYLMVQRLHPHPYLSIFNGPDTSMTTAVRDQSSVPLQALFLLNSPFVHAQAGRFAGRLIAEEPDPAARLRLAYLWTFARPPSDSEATQALAYLERYAQSLADEGVEPSRRTAEAWASLGRVLLASNEFISVD